MTIAFACALPHPPLIIPAVGRGEERGISSTVDACQAVADRVAEERPQTIIVSSPHAPAFYDGFYVCHGSKARGDMAAFRASQEVIECDYDTQLAQEVIRLGKEAGLPLGSSESDGTLDHGTFIALWFVEQAYQKRGIPCDYQVLRVGLSGLDYEEHRRLGQVIRQAVDSCERKVAFIASGDLSHKLKADGPYGFVPQGPRFDQEICRIFDGGDLEDLFSIEESFADQAAECGLRSFQIMAGALGGGWTPRLLSHEGPFGVGYGVAAFEPPCDDEALEDPSATGVEDAPEANPFVALARRAVEHYVLHGTPLPLPGDLDSCLTSRKAGVFVSLHTGTDGDLRGCIGTIVACCEHVAAEIIANAVSACSRDPRFSPVQPEELDYLSYSVDVLGPTHRIDSMRQLDTKRYGVVVSKDWRRGLLLPDLEGVDTPEQQVAIACRKAGIDPAEKGIMLERFEVVRHSAGGQARKEPA